MLRARYIAMKSKLKLRKILYPTTNLDRQTLDVTIMKLRMESQY